MRIAWSIDIAARKERIELLQSEISRLKSRLAAEAGDEDLMRFILRGYSAESKDHIDDIKERLRFVSVSIIFHPH